MTIPRRANFVHPHLSKGHTPSVLLVEDDLSIGEIIDFTLSGYNIQLIHAKSVEEALDYIHTPSSPPIDTIITDLMMEGPSGLDFIQTIKSNPLMRHIPIIVQSGAHSILTDKAKKIGIFSLLHKPYLSDELTNALQLALSDQGWILKNTPN